MFVKQEIWNQQIYDTIMVWTSKRGQSSKNSSLEKGRPTNKPEDLERKVKRLEMENELFQNFLQELERK